MEKWKKIRGFPDYSVSNTGLIRFNKTGRILSQYENQYGVVCIGLMLDGTQRHRSVPLLVARAFLPGRRPPFDTPINLDGNRHNNHVENLAWRPRWFSAKWNRQFREPYSHPINRPIKNIATGEIFDNSRAAVTHYGILEEDLVLSIMNRTVVWPLFQEFEIVEN
jgi:hypothetical protein